MHDLTAFRPRFGLACARSHIFLSQLDYVYPIYCVVGVAAFVAPRSQIFSRFSSFRFFFFLSIFYFQLTRSSFFPRLSANKCISVKWKMDWRRQNTCEQKKNDEKNWNHSHDDWKTEMNGPKWIYISIDGSRLLCFWWPPPTTPARCKRKWIAQGKSRENTRRKKVL